MSEFMQPGKAFHLADEGTAESRWLALLSHFGEWLPKRGPLTVIAPHPDDEILGAGGLVQSWAGLGESVTVVSVTDGEAADVGHPQLDLVRRGELRDALRKLTNIHVKIERLGLPDGRVGEHRNRLRNAIRQHCDPAGTLIAPYERDGHPDHQAVGEVCLEMSQAEGIPIARYPVWTWHHTEPEALRSSRWGLFPLTPAAQRAKRRALQSFESPLRPSQGLPVVPAQVLEHFHRPFEAFLV
jgi:LmbE family N-acetylglucosaminyl deacetylase